MDILFTGGSACGKSSLAEKILDSFEGRRIYIATMIPRGEDGRIKVERHKKMRLGKNFEVIEKYTGLKLLDIPENSSILLECICNLTANEMFEPEGSGRDAVSEVIDAVNAIKNKTSNLIVITNEVGNDGADYDESVLEYIKAMGEINYRLASEFPVICEMCCGIPLMIKGEMEWPL